MVGQHLSQRWKGVSALTILSRVVGRCFLPLLQNSLILVWDDDAAVAETLIFDSAYVPQTAGAISVSANGVQFPLTATRDEQRQNS